MPEQTDCVVIGAGVVGLAVARELALAGLETIVLENETSVGTGISSRNSEVIHAGIYYSPHSLKARLCVAGKNQLYSYCEKHRVAVKRTEKLIVATEDSQVAQLNAIKANAESCGVTDLEWLTGDQARALEPELSCVAALRSPSTGIVDSHGLMLSLQGDFEAAGGVIAFGSQVISGVVNSGGLLLRVADEQEVELQARYVVNCAGLGAQHFAENLSGLNKQSIPVLRFAKGNYFSLSGRSPFKRLIYPAPEAAGLGIHLTLDMSGAARFGPDVEWIDEIDHRVEPSRVDNFYHAIRRYWPGLPNNGLVPAYAGIRPKLCGPGDPAEDFSIQGEDAHGVAGLVNLYGIESPGLTACLAIAGDVKRRLLAP